MPRAVRRRLRSARWASLTAGLVVTALAAPALTLTHHTPPLALSAAPAIRAAEQDPQAMRALRSAHYDSVKVNPLDVQLDRVTFWSGGQIVAEVAVRRNGQVLQGINDRAAAVPYGNWLSYQPALLVGLSVLFLLMTLVAPWRRIQNLDATATLSVVISIVLFQHRYIDASLVAAVPGLGYLLGRCIWIGLGRGRVAAQSRPLLSCVAPGLDGARRVRWLRVALLVLVAIFVMVGVSSPDSVDVAYAVMEGATRLIHGVLPYGHMPAGIIHGDTYPILSYALYALIALFAPVYSVWYRVDGALAIAVVAAFVMAWAAFRGLAGPRVRRTRSRPPEQEEAGLRAAIAVLAFPPLLITVSTGTSDVVLGAMLVLALLVWRRPGAGGGVLAAAGWFKLAPFALLPLFLAPLRGKRLLTAVAAIASVSAAAVGLVVALGGLPGLITMGHAVSYQFTRGSIQSVWSVLGIGAVQPLAQATVLGLIAAATVRLWREPSLARDRARTAALAAAVLLGLQLAADYWAFLYLVWFVPLVCVSLLGSGAPTPRVVEVASAWTAPPRPAVVEA